MTIIHLHCSNCHLLTAGHRARARCLGCLMSRHPCGSQVTYRAHIIAKLAATWFVNNSHPFIPSSVRAMVTPSCGMWAYHSVYLRSPATVGVVATFPKEAPHLNGPLYYLMTDFGEQNTWLPYEQSHGLVLQRYTIVTRHQRDCECIWVVPQSRSPLINNG